MKTIACLAGDGVGPELMAAATRVLDRVAELHSLQLDDVHLPFGGEAVTRTGHPLPPETRAGYRDVDAILVAAPDNPALDGVKADLELAWRVARVQLDGSGDLVITGPVETGATGLRSHAHFRAPLRGAAACSASASPPTGRRRSRPNARAGVGSTSRRHRSRRRSSASVNSPSRSTWS